MAEEANSPKKPIVRSSYAYRPTFSGLRADAPAEFRSTCLTYSLLRNLDRSQVDLAHHLGSRSRARLAKDDALC